MAQRIFLVRIVILVVGIVPADQRSAPGTGFVVVVIAVLAQGRVLGSGVVEDPDAGSAVGTEGGVFAEAVRTQGLTVKDSAFPHGVDLSTVGAGKGVVHGIPPII